jgi:hypothetical protein
MSFYEHQKAHHETVVPRLARGKNVRQAKNAFRCVFLRYTIAEFNYFYLKNIGIIKDF